LTGGEVPDFLGYMEGLLSLGEYMAFFETLLPWYCFEDKNIFVVDIVVAVDAVQCLSCGGILEKMKKTYHPNSSTGLQKSK
jgi:hypothetical protein